jgi:DNA/RNA endonuclease YhcR with UshA esterase domain
MKGRGAMGKLLFILVVLFLGSSTAFADNVIDWKEAASHLGKYKTVEGNIVATKCLQKICFLNFDKNYQGKFTSVIFVSDIKKFPANPDRFYLNKKVQVTGVIESYKDTPQIVLKDPGQIRIMDK